jgi:hypothetical protein
MDSSGESDGQRSGAETAGEAAGGLSGLTAGAALGSLAGSLGTIVGAVAGAVGGWWAVHAATTAHTRLTPEQEVALRQRHTRRAGDDAEVPWDRARSAYQLGFLAGCNPRYLAEGFAAAERELRHGWTSGVAAELGPWEHHRDLVHDGFECARQSVGARNAPGAGMEPLHSDPATEAANRAHDRVAELRRPTDER